MKPLDYVLIALVVLVVFFAVRSIVRRKKSGKCIGCSCDCGCGQKDCPSQKK